MKYPNLRYGEPGELEYQAKGLPLPTLGKRLRRSERSVRDWRHGNAKMPWWVPEILRLQNLEHEQQLYRMNVRVPRVQLGTVDRSGALLAFDRDRIRKPAAATPRTRLDAALREVRHG